MAGKPEFPMVDVAAAVITRGKHVLVAFNSKWSSFTLPMTKRRTWQDPRVPRGRREEAWEDAAARAAAECLGRTSKVAPEFIADLPEWQQGDRDGVWKRYHYQVFRIALSEADEPQAGAIVEWLTPGDILDHERRPISPSARHIVHHLQAEAALQGKSFPW